MNSFAVLRAMSRCRLTATLTGVLLLGLPLAGCLGAGTLPPPGAPTPLEAIGAPVVQDHDHGDAAAHRGHANVALVGYHSGYGDGSGQALPADQGFSEMAVWQGQRDGQNVTLAFLGRRDGPDGGFSLLDATDPRHIKHLADYPGLAAYDVEVTADGSYAFFTTQWLPSQQQSGAFDPENDQRGVYIVDLADLSHPTAAGFFYPPTRGAHTITYYKTAEGRELLTVNTYDFIPDPSLALPLAELGSNPVAHRTFLTEFKRGPAPHLEILSILQKTDHIAPPGKSYFPHDTFIQLHPVTGQLLLYLAYWDLGAFIYDISNPANPVELSQMTDFTPSQWANIHFVRPAPQLIDGIHLTITEPEIGPTDETGQLTFYDTTDPAQPKRLGYWTLPGHLAITEGLNFSPHNFDIQRGRIYLAHYHGGVWVIDIHNKTLLDHPENLGYYQVAQERNGKPVFAPDFWSAFQRDGLIYASDVASGLHVLRFAGD